MMQVTITKKDLMTLNAEGEVRLEKHPYVYVLVED